jgi:predicted ArsR family transcriptional regulator
MTAMGPAPARGADRGQRLSPARARVLEALQHAAAPVHAADLATALGASPSTVREHLQALVAGGYATAEPDAPSGRGRPAVRYRPSPSRVEPDRRVREYGMLAGALASQIAALGPESGGHARRAGQAWARAMLAEGGPARAVGPLKARRTVVAVLEDLGFSPAADRAATDVALRRCPLLDVARRHPEVVCAVHLGLVRGLLAELSPTPAAVELVPFAEPGACRLAMAHPEAKAHSPAPGPVRGRLP